MESEDSVDSLRAEIKNLHADCFDLVRFIVSARSEISQIHPNDLKEDKLPRAGKELDAIVQSTENATNQIMEAAEKIMDAKVTDANVVSDACMEIFEACSFQDITGQRISKVVSTLEYIETYLDKLTSAWDHDGDGLKMAKPESVDEEAALLNGPALEGEGIDQNYVDNMFASTPEVKPQDEAVPDDPPKKDSKTPDKDGSIDQDDIDALFN
ncbi:MAG: protein phosphatase CheZ [Sneathiella sp.]